MTSSGSTRYAFRCAFRYLSRYCDFVSRELLGIAQSGYSGKPKPPSYSMVCTRSCTTFFAGIVHRRIQIGGLTSSIRSGWNRRRTKRSFRFVMIVNGSAVARLFNLQPHGNFHWHKSLAARGLGLKPSPTDPKTQIYYGFPWFASVQTGGVRTGSNRKCDQFSWFDLVPSRSCLLPIKYKSSAEYCLPFCRLLLYANICNPIDKPRNFIIRKVTYHICSKIPLLCSTRIKYSTSLLPPQPKDCFKRREPVPARRFNGVHRHWVRTTRCAPSEFEWVRIGFDSMVRTLYSFGPVRTMESQW